ncbi:MAG: sensor histidine kinase [Qingshengfaniella sp.]
MRDAPRDSLDETLSISLLDGVPVPLILVGPDEMIVHMNIGAAALFGGGMDGRHLHTVLRRPDVLHAIGQTLADGSRQEARLLASDHTHDTIYRVISVPVVTGRGTGTLISFEDITPLETAGQMRRDFVANVSHELRTPLTALMGFVETLRGPARDDAAARDRFLATMEREAERMNRLINDLLSLSRVEDQERMVPTERVDLTALLISVCSALRPLAGDMTIEMDVPDALEIIGDPDQLRQVMTNLIENALKYGRDGGRVRLGLSHVARDPVLREAAIKLDVEDFGAGIPEVHIHRLTERFYRADSHRSRDLGGTGLGLAIVKHIMNRHRGRLTIRSVPGEITCFSAIFPDPSGKPDA